MIRRSFPSGGSWRAWLRWQPLVLVAALSSLLVDGAAAPAVTGFTPSLGGPGTQVTLTGAGFASATLVQFDMAAADFIVGADNRLVAVVPPEATTGRVRVTNPGGTGMSSADFVVAPRISGFYPLRSATNMEVTIDGFNFGNTTGVSFGGRPASHRITAATQLRATVPPGATNGPIQVVTPAGVALTTNDFVVTGPGPILDSFSPMIGPPGAEVLVYGANFTNVTAVTFNKVAAAEFSAPAPTQIRARAPANATTGKLAITTSRGSVTSVVDFVVTRAPVITGFTPWVGRDGFTPVTIEGLNFSDVRGVGFNGKGTTGWGTPAPNQLVVTVPAGATTGRITVTNAYGYGAGSNDFVITLAPIIDYFYPTNAARGASMWINGVNLSNGFTVLKFNGVNASFQVTGQNGTQIQATVPANATTGPLTMTNAYGSFTTPSNFFVTGSAPYVTDLSPDRGPRGTKVTITGGNFTAPVTVRFNGVTDPTAEVTALTQIQATAPPGALTGPVTVTTAVGTSTNGPVYYAPPRLTAITPAESVVGDTIVLSGTNFTGTTAVWIGGLSTAFTVTASNRISLVIPPEVVTGAMTLTTPGGTFIATNVLRVLPRITGFAPALGPAGTVVTIQGTTFRNVSAVTFNNISATTFTNVSMNEVRATVPAAAATGAIRVTTPDGTAVSPSNFLVTRDSDLAVRKTASATLVQPGERVTFTLVATNLGPSIVTGVRVADTFPSGLSPVSASADRGACGIANGVVTCDVGSLTNGTAVTVSIAALASEEGMWSNRATIAAVEGDPVSANDLDQVLVTVSSLASRQLSVRPTSTADAVVLSWPVSPVPFLLQSTASLPPTNPWVHVSTPPFVVGGQNVVTSPVSDLRQFYRLKGP